MCKKWAILTKLFPRGKTLTRLGLPQRQEMATVCQVSLRDTQRFTMTHHETRQPPPSSDAVDQKRKSQVLSRARICRAAALDRGEKPSRRRRIWRLGLLFWSAFVPSRTRLSWSKRHADAQARMLQKNVLTGQGQQPGEEIPFCQSRAPAEASPAPWSVCQIPPMTHAGRIRNRSAPSPTAFRWPFLHRPVEQSATLIVLLEIIEAQGYGRIRRPRQGWMVHHRE